MAKENGRIGPWSDIDVAIEGEALAKDGLRKKRKALERIVTPFVTTRKTADEILFKGKRCYLKFSMLNGSSLNPQWWAVMALQYLYSVESAWKAGDIDKVVRATFGLAHADNQKENYERWHGSTEVLARVRKQAAKSGRPRKLTDEERARATVLFAKLKADGSLPNAAVTKILRDIIKGRSVRVGKSTIERAVGIRQN